MWTPATNQTRDPLIAIRTDFAHWPMLRGLCGAEAVSRVKTSQRHTRSKKAKSPKATRTRSRSNTHHEHVHTLKCIRFWTFAAMVHGWQGVFFFLEHDFTCLCIKKMRPKARRIQSGIRNHREWLAPQTQQRQHNNKQQERGRKGPPPQA
jgi:hypothetical protein